jgi:phage terminase small subunit
MSSELITTDQLTGKQEHFAQLVAAGASAAEAVRQAYAVRPGTTAHSVRQQGYALLRHPQVAMRITELRTAVAERFVDNVTALRLRQFDIAQADPLTDVRVFNCRKCHGVGNRYQWLHTDEFYDAVEQWQVTKDQKPQVMPSDAGGYGFDPFAPPAPDCPYCLGAGQAVVFMRDTTLLTPSERAAYKGASVDKYGVITVEQHDQQDAARELHRMIPGAIAPQRSESKNLTVHVEPLKDMTPEAIVELMQQQRLLT